MNAPVDIHSDQNRGNISFKFEVGQKFAAILLALSIMMNVVCVYVINEYRTEKRLQQYDLDYFKSTDFAAMKGEVNSHDALIKAYVIAKECKK